MLRQIRQLVTATATVAVAAQAAWAHPGHGVIPADEPAHWLEPVHFVPVALAGAFVAVVWRLRARRDRS